MWQPKATATRDIIIGNSGVSGEKGGPHLYKSSYEHVYEVKVVIVGDMGVGKTSIAARFAKGIFNPQYIATVGGSFLSKAVQMRDYTIAFRIWDTAGQERFRSLVPMYLRGAKAALLVYDVTSLESFKLAGKWLKELHCHCAEDTVMMLIGAKCDMPSAVDPSTAQEFAAKNGMLFMETSSKTGHNVDKVFRMLASEMAITDKENINSGFDLSDSYSDSTKKKRCCHL
ncbi:hypothetical protein ACJMK2_013420 [Sinanodonta woodiana]|uniref:Uncharacterized protein n=1 Tax=Sinanodonta woodiana TaxID=1069815 RepID=A0ABD3UY50_SINWO